MVLAAAQPDRCDSIKTDDLIACAAAELKSEEAALADVFRRFRATLDEQDRRTRETCGSNLPADLAVRGTTMLDGEQAAWLAYRDASCERRTYENLGGRERPIYVLACRARLTRERIEDLRRGLEPAPTRPKTP
jgi:uncharacterized protein YecT (DUF1311 family)